MKRNHAHVEVVARSVPEDTKLVNEGHLSLARSKVTLSALITLGALSILFSAAFATWTASATSPTQTLKSGEVIIGFGTADDLGTGAAYIAPGDTIQRAVDLTDTAATQVATTITLGVTDACGTCAASTMDTTTSSTAGLQVVVTECSVAWTRSAALPDGGYTYTCSGTTTSALASTPMGTLETTPATLSGLNTELAGGGTDHLLVTLTFATGSPSTMENLTSTVEYVFSATARPGQPM